MAGTIHRADRQGTRCARCGVELGGLTFKDEIGVVEVSGAFRDYGAIPGLERRELNAVACEPADGRTVPDPRDRKASHDWP